MSLERAATTMGAMISEALTALACGGNGERCALVRTHLVDDLVLVVTEHEPARCGAGAAGRGRSRDLERCAPQRRAAVEAIVGRPVAATLNGRLADPEVDFELFVLRPEARARRLHAVYPDLPGGDFGYAYHESVEAGGSREDLEDG